MRADIYGKPHPIALAFKASAQKCKKEHPSMG